MMAIDVETGSDPLITYTLFESVTPTTKQERADVAWSDLVARIVKAPTYLSKAACPLISLAEFGDQPSPAGCIRHAGNVRRVFGVEVDYDGEQMPPEEAAALLANARLEAVLYTSPSHTEQAPRWRVLLPLSEAALPEKRAEYVGRANRILRGGASRESFTLSQSFYIGRVRGAPYVAIPTRGRPIDLAAELEPLYFVGGRNDGASKVDRTTDEQLRASFVRGEDRYQSMLKLSARWAARGLPRDDIEAALHALLDECPSGTQNGDGVELRAHVGPMAASAWRKFGETRVERADPLRGTPVPPEDGRWAPIETYTDEDVPPDLSEEEWSEPVVKKETGAVALFRPLAEIVAEKREAEWLLRDVLEANVLAILAGPRGTFKSFIALDWAMRIALQGHGVLMLSGEGAGLDRRVDAWHRTYAQNVELADLKIAALERPMNLNLDESFEYFDRGVAGLPWVPKLIIVDTFSKFSAGIDENDNGEISTFLSRLSDRLRHTYGATVVLVAHSGHADSGRPRGASALMANPDAEYIVTRQPQAMNVEVSRERFKDTPSLPPLAYEARVVDLGRVDRYSEPVTSLALFPLDGISMPRPVNGPGKGRHQAAALQALKVWSAANPATETLTSDSLKAMLKAASLPRQRRHDILEYLVAVGVLTPSVGGFRINKDAF